MNMTVHECGALNVVGFRFQRKRHLRVYAISVYDDNLLYDGKKKK